MSRLQYNGVLAHLDADLTAGATSITFDVPLTYNGGTNVPTLAGDYFAMAILDANAVPREIVYVTAYTAGATTATITRGQEGTTGVTHDAGVIVLHSPTVYDYNPLTNPAWAAKGDLLVGTANDTAQILSSTGATDGQVLTRDVAETSGMKWATPGWTKIIDDALASATNVSSVTGTWGINAGVLRQSNAAVNAEAYYNQAISPAGTIAVQCEAAFVSGSGTRRFGIEFRARGSAGENMVAYIESTDGTNWTPRVERGGASLLYTGSAISVSAGTYKTFLCIVSGVFLDFIVDGVNVGRINASNMVATYDYRYIGFYTNTAVADFRNLKVWRGLSVPS